VTDHAKPHHWRSGPRAAQSARQAQISPRCVEKGNNALPADIEGQVFSYFDELSARRKTGKAKAAGAAEGDAPAGA
jgi:hypothetical protein